MAITYGSKVFESKSTANAALATALGSNIAAGKLLVLSIMGAASSTITVSSVTDDSEDAGGWTVETGGSFQTASSPAKYVVVATAYKFVGTQMSSAKKVTVNFSTKPAISAWVSCHTFDGVPGAYESKSAAGSLSTGKLSLTMNVAGSSWMTLGTAILNLEFDVQITPSGGATVKDTNAADTGEAAPNGSTVAPWAFLIYETGTTGTSNTLDVTYGTLGSSYRISAVSFGTPPNTGGKGFAKNTGLWAV